MGFEDQTTTVKGFFGNVGRRQLIIAGTVLLIGAAVVVNWMLFSGNDAQSDGYDGYQSASDLITSHGSADGKNDQSAGQTEGNDTVKDVSDNYFASTQVSRQRARDEAIEVLQGVVDNAQADEATKAQALAEEIEGSLVAGQFTNPANPEAHYKTTGPEIWQDTEGKVDIFVAGIGTGGTISGVGRFLKEKNPKIRIVGVEPADSPLLTTGKAGPHGIQGIGANFVPEILDTGLLDQVVTVTTEEAYAAGRRLGTEEGVLAGISAGAALHVALELAKQEENAGKTIVALLPDSGERYLTTPMYQK